MKYLLAYYLYEFIRCNLIWLIIMAQEDIFGFISRYVSILSVGLYH